MMLAQFDWTWKTPIRKAAAVVAGSCVALMLFFSIFQGLYGFLVSDYEKEIADWNNCVGGRNVNNCWRKNCGCGERPKKPH